MLLGNMLMTSKTKGFFKYIYIYIYIYIPTFTSVKMCFAFSMFPSSKQFSFCGLGKPELRTVDIIVSDVKEPDSLAAMCKQAVIVLNCVGPVSI